MPCVFSDNILSEPTLTFCSLSYSSSFMIPDSDLRDHKTTSLPTSLECLWFSYSYSCSLSWVRHTPYFFGWVCTGGDSVCTWPLSLRIPFGSYWLESTRVSLEQSAPAIYLVTNLDSFEVPSLFCMVVYLLQLNGFFSQKLFLQLYPIEIFLLKRAYLILDLATLLNFPEVDILHLRSCNEVQALSKALFSLVVPALQTDIAARPDHFDGKYPLTHPWTNNQGQQQRLKICFVPAKMTKPPSQKPSISMANRVPFVSLWPPDPKPNVLGLLLKLQLSFTQCYIQIFNFCMEDAMSTIASFPPGGLPDLFGHPDCLLACSSSSASTFILLWEIRVDLEPPVLNSGLEQDFPSIETTRTPTFCMRILRLLGASLRLFHVPIVTQDFCNSTFWLHGTNQYSLI